MRIAILSDTHGQQTNVQAALQVLAGWSVDILLHCGDIDDVDTVWLFPANTHFVFGNCDYDRPGLRRAIADLGATLHQPYGELELDGVRLAFIHGDNRKLLDELEWSNRFDFLFYGHTHLANEHHAGTTRVINPGALYRARTKTCAVLDLGNGRLTSLVVG